MFLPTSKFFIFIFPQSITYTMSSIVMLWRVQYKTQNVIQYNTIKYNKSVFRLVNLDVDTTPCCEAIAAGACRLISCLQGTQQQTHHMLLLHSNDGTGRQTDKRTPDCYTDPAPQAASQNAAPLLVTLSISNDQPLGMSRNLPVYPPIKTAPSWGGWGLPSNTWFLGPTPHIPNIMIGPAVFAGLTKIVTNRQLCYICSNSSNVMLCMWCGVMIANNYQQRLICNRASHFINKATITTRAV